jgi:16S rRNA (adenine1518-N6/adenine1519-N6)-dimethyltransferase
MIKPKKSLGQNFLNDNNILNKIIHLSEITNNNIIEIGPGTGNLTKKIIEQKPKSLILIEKDSDLIEYLKNEFVNYKSLRIFNEDILKFKLEKKIKKNTIIIGNLPYNISSQIIFKAIENRNLVHTLVGMFQLEVAKRICEGPGSKTYGILSVLVQAYYETEFMFSLDPLQFTPPPKVNSGVIKLTRKTQLTLNCDEVFFFKIVKTSFQQRRKTLRNSLKVFNLSNIIKEDVIFDRRPETLSVDDFVYLTNIIANGDVST